MQNGIYSGSISSSLVETDYCNNSYAEEHYNNLIAGSVRNIMGGNSVPVSSSMAGAISIASTSHTQLVPFKLTLGKIIGNSDDEDPYQGFVMNPYNRAKAEGLYVAIACKDLPIYFRELQFDWRSAQVQNLLGMLCKDILPEDKKKFNKICLAFKKSTDNRYEQMAFTSDISYLLHKYGRKALYRHVGAYTECCRKAWHHYNQGEVKKPDDRDIFTADAEKCYKKLFHPINELTKPKQEWMEIIANGIYFRDYCSGLAAAIKIRTNPLRPALPVTEKFDNIFYNVIHDPEPSYQAGENINRTNVQSVLQNLVNVFTTVRKNK